MNSADLVARLREPAWEIVKDGMEPVIEVWRADMAEAADRIEALLEEMTRSCLAERAGRLAAEVERDRLREAGAYYIDRLKAAWAGKPVRDMGEAESAWRAALQKEPQP